MGWAGVVVSVRSSGGFSVIGKERRSKRRLLGRNFEIRAWSRVAIRPREITWKREMWQTRTTAGRHGVNNPVLTNRDCLLSTFCCAKLRRSCVVCARKARELLPRGQTPLRYDTKHAKLPLLFPFLPRWNDESKVASPLFSKAVHTATSIRDMRETRKIYHILRTSGCNFFSKFVD